MRIAFAGNPNSGKTTMYNALTGRTERVGNWAGVTIDKKESPIKKHYYEDYYEGEELIAVDLPGAYSMSPFTAEESVTRDYIINERPDVIINIVDATNLSRSLFFTTQLMELGVPVVIALNKADINLKKETEINVAALSDRLGCPVINTISTISTHESMHQIVDAAICAKGKGQAAPFASSYAGELNKETARAADVERYKFVNEIVRQVEKRKIYTKDRNFQDSIDNILTDPIVGMLVFAAVMFVVFDISQSTFGPALADILVGWIEVFQNWVGGMLVGANDFLYALLIDGIIGGVGAVVGFLPLVMVMYFLIALLEDCGYMARATVVLDPIFKKVGLSGKSVIPMVVGTGCAIPGIMSCRTIHNERERRVTAMLAPFMPCGAKLPVIALFAGAFFGDESWIGTLMYFVGIFLVFVGALLVNKISGLKYRTSFFIMELPEYKLPSLKRAVTSMLARGKSYIVKAGTVILFCNTIVQVMQSFNWSLDLIGEGMEHTSILATIASPVSILLIPVCGIAAWQLAAAAITGFIAKENVVGTLAVCYALTNFIDTEELALMGGSNEVAMTMGLTKVAALAFLMFNLFTPPCFAALGAMNSEMASAKWFWGGVALQFATGYTIAFLVYQMGTLITTGALGAGFVGGLIAVLCFAVIMVLVAKKNAKAA